MDRVALKPTEKLDALTEIYNQRLLKIEAYAQFPNAYRLEMARQVLSLVFVALDANDETEFLQYIQAKLEERLKQGVLVEAFAAAISALEDVIVAGVESLEDAMFLWRMFSHCREIVSAQTLKMLRQTQEVFPGGAVLATKVEVPASGEAIVHDFVLTPLEDVENVSLLDLISVENLQEIQNAFAVATGVASIITDLDGRPITAASNFSRVCDMVRATSMGYSHCINSDKVLGENSKKLMRPTYQECLSCGFADASAPIIVGGQHIANWLIGQTNVMEAGTDRIAQYAREIGADVNEMVAAYRTIPGMPIEKFEKILDLLWHFAREISTAGYNILQLRQDIAKRKQAEKALQESEQKLSHIIDFLPDAAMVIDRTGVVLAWNRAIEVLTGVPAEDMLGRGNYEYALPFYGERKPLLIDQVRNASTELSQHYFELKQQGGTTSGSVYVTLQGRERYLSINASPLYDADGNIAGAIETIRDDTERKQLELQVQESLARRARQVQTSTEVAQQIAVAPALDDLFKRVTDLIKERFGYYHVHVYMLEGDYLIMKEGVGEAGRLMKQRGHKIAVAAEKSLTARAARTGKAVLVPDVSQEPGWLPNDLLPQTKSELAVPISLGDKVLGILDVQSNVIDGLGSEDELLLLGLCGQIAIAIQTTQLLEETTVFRSFAETSGQGVAIATLEGHLTYANPTLLKIFGEPSIEDLQGKSVLEYYPEVYQQKIEHEIRPTVMQTGQWVGEAALRSKSGKLTPVLENIFIIHDRYGQPLYIADLVTDITEQKRTEAELGDRVRELTALQQAMSREGWAAWRDTGALHEGYLFDQIAIQPVGDPDNQVVGGDNAAELVPILIHSEEIGMLGVYNEPDNPLSPEDLALIKAVSEQVSLALENARLFEQTQQALAEQRNTASQLSERVKELNCLNDIGREITENPPIDAFLEWVCQRTPAAMQYPDLSAAVIEYENHLYGDPAALQMPSKIVNGLRITGQLVGRVHIGYAQERSFLDEESAMLGGIASRVSGYIENQRLLEQIQQRAAELEDTTVFLNSVLDNIPSSLFVKDATDLRYIRWNKAGETMYGLLASDVEGKTNYDLFPKETVAEWEVQDRTVLQQKSPVDIMEERIHTAHRGMRYLHTTKVPILGSDGQARYLLGISEDITERKQAEEERERLLSEVQESQLFLRTLMDNISLPIFYKNRQGAYMGFNKAFLEYIGTTEEQLWGKTVFDLNTDQTLAAQYHEADMAVFRNPQVQVYEAKVKYADGILRDVIFNKAPFYDTEGKLGGLVGTMMDITERKQAEETIQRERSLLRAVIDSIPDLIFFKDTQSVYLGCNKAFEEFAGRTEDELMKRNDVELFGAEVGNFFREMDVQMMAESQSRRNEEWVDYPDGRHRLLDTLKAPFFNREGVTLGIIGISRDITERKQAEETIRQNEAQLSEAATIAQLGHWEFDVQAQIFTFTDQLYALLRTTAAQEGGYQMPAMQYAQKFVHPDDNYIVGTAIQNAIETSDPNYATQLEHRIIRADGSAGHIIVRFRVIKDEQGRTVKTVGANQDITERKLAEQERERLLAEVEAAYRQYVSREWEQYLSDKYQGEYTIEAVNQAAGGQTVLQVPIALRGQAIGMLSLQDVASDRIWAEDEKALITTVTEQLALTIENLRLFDDTQRRAVREQLTREISDKMRASSDVDSIIQVGLAELAKALGVSRTYVKLAPEVEPNGH